MSESSPSEASVTSPQDTGSLRERILLGIGALAMAPSLLQLADTWRSVDYLSHGFLVPVVSLWIWMRERPRRERHPIRPETAGVAVVALGFLGMAWRRRASS